MTPSAGGQRFPCPICAMPQEVRLSKKDKPYITCNVCGVQVFIRGRAGIDEFKKMIAQGTFVRLNEMIRRYYVRCSTCGKQFWVEPRFLVTSMFDGSLKGVRCPEAECEAVLPWEQVA